MYDTYINYVYYGFYKCNGFLCSKTNVFKIVQQVFALGSHAVIIQTENGEMIWLNKSTCIRYLVGSVLLYCSWNIFKAFPEAICADLKGLFMRL